MKTATGLFLIGLGGILAFAVTAQTPVLNLQVAGLIVLLTGLVGLVLPAGAAGWLRRHVVLRRGAAVPGPGQFEDASYSPSYLISDPAVMASQLLEEAELADAAAPADPAASGTRTRRLRPVDTLPDDTLPVDAPPDRSGGPGPAARAQPSAAAAVLRDLFTD